MDLLTRRCLLDWLACPTFCFTPLHQDRNSSYRELFTPYCNAGTDRTCIQTFDEAAFDQTARRCKDSCFSAATSQQQSLFSSSCSQLQLLGSSCFSATSTSQQQPLLSSSRFSATAASQQQLLLSSSLISAAVCSQQQPILCSSRRTVLYNLRIHANANRHVNAVATMRIMYFRFDNSSRV